VVSVCCHPIFSGTLVCTLRFKLQARPIDGVNTGGVTPTFLLRYMREIFSREQGSAVPTLVGEA
ncbi:unnamed protein product, partial [Pylaiella littoralis]